MVAYKKPEDMTVEEMLSVLKKHGGVPSGHVLNPADAKARVDQVMFAVNREPHITLDSVAPEHTFVDPSYLMQQPQTPMTAQQLDQIREALKAVSPKGRVMLGPDGGVRFQNSWSKPWLSEFADPSPDAGVHVWAATRPPEAEFDGRDDYLPTSDDKEPDVGQNRIWVKDMRVEYRDPGMSMQGIGTSSRFAGPGQMEATFTVILPPDTNPNDFLNWLKNASITGAPLPAPAPVRHEMEQETAALRHQLEVAGNKLGTQTRRVTKLEEELLKIAAEKDTAEKSLIQLRARMNQALCMMESPSTAAEVYRQALDRWANSLAEGAAFTAAEGEELVQRLVEMLQYIDIARATNAGEEEPRKVPAKKNDTEHLF
jgi:hypothetical protein